METEKTQILVVTNDRWSRDSYVVFEGDKIIGGCIPDEWVSETFSNLEMEADDNGDELYKTREQVADDMESDFFTENSDVDEFWSEYGILRAGNNYYTYRDDGTCEPIDEDDALDIIHGHEKRINEWNCEQSNIANAEIVTPRQAGVIDRFGIDDAEKNEMADDVTVLRKFNGCLYVYEAQIGEPAQWRLLQNSPHMPTGTLPRPKQNQEVGK